jgi:hypothetical integral membrane protein (TIGR02206 family)
VVWAALYLTVGLGMRPTWHSYRFTLLITVCWAVGAFAFNSVADTNYGFINAKPAVRSLLDVLGPWPWYLLPVFALVVTVWAVMTAPFDRRGDRQAGSPAPRRAS